MFALPKPSGVNVSFSVIWTCPGNGIIPKVDALRAAAVKSLGPTAAQRLMEEFESTRDNLRNVLRSLCTNTAEYAEFAKTHTNLQELGEKAAQLLPKTRVAVRADATSNPKRAIFEAWTTAAGDAQGKMIQVFDLTFNG